MLGSRRWTVNTSWNGDFDDEHLGAAMPSDGAEETKYLRHQLAKWRVVRSKNASTFARY